MEKKKQMLMSIKVRALLFLWFMAVLFMFSNVYSIYHGAKCEQQFDRVLTKYYTINRFLKTFSDSPVLFETYMGDKTEQNWIRFVENEAKVKSALSQMVREAEDMSLESFLLIQSVKNTYANYHSIAWNALPSNHEVMQLIMVKQSSSQILEYTNELLQESLTFGTDIHRNMQREMQLEHRISLVLMAVVAAASVFFAAYMKQKVLDPIARLSEAVGEITRENFDVEDLVSSGNDEIGHLNRSVNQMKRAMKTVIGELKEKQILSQRLHAQEIKIMNSEKMLEKAKFSLLQSQINPHFLFNTLNVISGAAAKEGAEVTLELIGSLSRLFRYTLENKEETVTLSKELNVLRSFIYIQKKRFGDRLEYRLKAGVETDRYRIPPFTLQPLVENGIKHGVLVRERGGMVGVRIWEDGEELIIRILDNGVGMSREAAQKLMRPAWGEGTGIGMGNVFERLRLVYPESRVKVYSKQQMGTCIEIRISLEECMHD